MIHPLPRLRNFMSENNLDYFIVPSTDEYLNEYNELENNARHHITGFSGSTGDAIVTKEDVLLFVDGRYHKQADDEVEKELVNVVKLDVSQSMKVSLFEKLQELAGENSKIGIIASKTSFKDYQKLDEKKLNLVEYNQDIIINSANSGIKKNKPQNLSFVSNFICGTSPEEKLKNLVGQINTDYLVVTKLEEIAYLTNLRCFEIPFSSSFKAKAVISKEKCFIFADIENLDEVRDNFSEQFEFFNENEFENKIIEIENNHSIAIDTSSITLKTYREIEATGCKIVEVQSPIAIMKSIKNDSEINHIKDSFLRSDIVLNRVICWVNQSLDNNLVITEKDLYDKVSQYFFEQEALALSFNTIASVDKNTAIIHYGSPSDEEIIKDGSLVLLDFGAYFEGGYATDCTRSFFAGKQNTQPTETQKSIYTSVLKGLLNGLYYSIEENKSGFDIDSKVREVVNQNLQEGFSFSHGTGHGVGISVHEFPPSISSSELAKTPLATGTVFTIEPGLYNPEWGGVRLENTVCIDEKDGKKFIKSLVKYNFDKKLISYEMLTEQEKSWLLDYKKSAIG